MAPRTIPVSSMKGGVGKTTVTIGLAKALRELGYTVGLLDIDVAGSALPRAMGLSRPPGYDSVENGRLVPVKHDGFEIFSIGLLFQEDAATMWKGDMKADGIRQILSDDIVWDENTDFILIDTPPTSGDEVQSLFENIRNVLGTVIVTQPNELSLLGMRKTIDLLKKTGTPISGMVTNMAGYECPQCHAVSNPFDRGLKDGSEMAAEFGIAHLGDVPLADEQVRQIALTSIAQNILNNEPVLFKVPGPSFRRKGIGWLKTLTDVATRS